MEEKILAAAIAAKLDAEGLTYVPQHPDSQAHLWMTGVRDVRISDNTFQIISIMRAIIH